MSEMLALLVGIIGTCVAIYQWAVINESKKRMRELQYLLAGISSSAISKAQAWTFQINTLGQPQNEADAHNLRSHIRARDDLMEIHSVVSALEGTIDADNSAITSNLKKTLNQSELNNRIQQTAIDNPTRSKNLQSAMKLNN